MRDELLSPELVLVDPELAARARPALPEPRAPVWERQRPSAPAPAPMPPPAAAPAQLPAPAPRPQPETRPRYPVWARVVAAVWILLIGVLIGGAAVPHAQDRPRVVPTADDVICEMDGTAPTQPPLPARPLPGSGPP